MIEPPVSPPFSPELLDATISVLHHVYAVNRDHTDPELGHDETSHGVLLYKSITHFLPGAVAGLPDVRSEIENGSLRVIEGPRSFRCFRIGYSELEDPWRSFPHNRGAAPAMAASNVEQLHLFDDVDGSEEPAGLEYIVGHCGSSLRGLRAVHLCLPLGRADERVRQWLSVRTLFRADRDDERGQPAIEPRPPIVPTPEPTVRLRPARKEAAQEGEG